MAWLSSILKLKLSRSISHINRLSTRWNTGSRAFATYELSDKDSEDDFHLSGAEDQEEPKQKQPDSVSGTNNGSKPTEIKIQNSSDLGIYRAILLGEVGQLPVQKRLRSGRVITMFSVGTGGMRNNRRPLDDESPREYADRSMVQWHRVSIYADNLGGIAMQHLKQGAHVYLEGNLETKIFSDPITGLVKRVREIAIRREGRLVFLNDGNESTDDSRPSLKGVGYF